MSLAACQKDSFLGHLEAEVLTCVPSNDKRFKGKYLISLSDTVLFPEGGGQPTDFGQIAGAFVELVYRDNNSVIQHVCEQSFSPGEKVKVEVDWDRRFDHMQQHTGQHLASAVAYDLFKWETVGWNMGETVSNIEFKTPQVSSEELASLEKAINLAIFRGLDVTVKLQEEHEAGDDDGSAQLRSRGVKNGVIPVPVRLIEIQGLDLNTCCGTHLQSTTQLQSLKLLGTQRGRKGTTRINFVAGDRVLATMQGMFERQTALIRLTTTEPQNQHEYVSNLIQTNTGQKKQITAFKSHCARQALSSVLSSRASKVDDETINNEALRVISIHGNGTEVFPADAADLAILSQEMAALDKLTCGLFTVVVPGTPDEGLFLIHGPPAFVKEHASKAAQIIAGRGGGRPGIYQGKCTQLSSIEEALTYLRQAAGQV